MRTALTIAAGIVFVWVVGVLIGFLVLSRPGQHGRAAGVVRAQVDLASATSTAPAQAAAPNSGAYTFTATGTSGLHFTGAYATRDSQGRIDVMLVSGAVPYTLTVNAQDVAFLIFPDAGGTLALGLSNVANGRRSINTLSSSTLLSSAQGGQAAQTPQLITSKCDPTLLSVLPWPMPNPPQPSAGMPTPAAHRIAVDVPGFTCGP